MTMLDELFDVKKGVPVYKGYVDDPRNTDNAWIETTAVHFHCNDEQAAEREVRRGFLSRTLRRP